MLVLFSIRQIPEELSELTELIVGDLSLMKYVNASKALNSKSQYSMADKGVAGSYMTEPVHTFWQDLLISAAREQGLPEPSVEPFTGPKTTWLYSGTNPYRSPSDAAAYK